VVLVPVPMLAGLLLLLPADIVKFLHND